MPTRCRLSSNKPPPLAPELNPVELWITRPLSKRCIASTRPGLLRSSAPPVKPSAVTGCPGISPSERPRVTALARNPGTCSRHRSRSTWLSCDSTSQRAPPRSTLIFNASWVTWQLVTTVSGATTTPEPSEKPPWTRSASTFSTLAARLTSTARSVSARAGAATRSQRARATMRFMATRDDMPSRFGRLKGSVDERHTVFLQDGQDLGALGFDQAFDLLLPFALAIAHAHGHLVVELDAAF